MKPDRPVDEYRLRLCAPVTDDGAISARCCQSRRMAVAEVRHGEVTDWREYEVGWDRLHDEGDRRDRMAAFLRAHDIDVIVVDHVGHCLRSTLSKVAVAVRADATGPARSAVLLAAADPQAS